MEYQRCCPIDPDSKQAWEKELYEDWSYLENINIHEVSQIFKVLNNHSRLKIAILLSKRDYCVCELVKILKEKNNSVSYNLNVLKEYQLVDSYYRSKDKYYKLDEKGIKLIRCLKHNLICEL
ncbi:ArsR/SmtB family transcription factor [Methanobacterium sp.]|uniref:ArsR/SmtB family transcription factor n=1 Tax=Methanobacterium sp. TaxID=2164 RepID=UPI003C75F422